MSPLTNHAWIALCLASIFICFKTEASPLATLPKPSAAENPQVINAFPSFNIDDVKDAEPMPKIIIARSADADDNSVDDDDDNENKSNKTEKPNSDNSEEIFPDDNKNHHHQNHHAHGSHGGLGPVKHLLNTVRDRVHGGGGGMLGGLGNILGGINHRANTAHESPIETEEDRTMINSSTGLHVLEVLGTLFGLLWGFLSNIPALFASSSSGLSGGGQ